MPSTKISRFQQQNKRFGKIFRRGHPHTRSWVSGDAMRDILVGKLQQIEDKYYYSLDLNYYLNNLEDDAYEA